MSIINPKKNVRMKIKNWLSKLERENTIEYGWKKGVIESILYWNQII